MSPKSWALSLGIFALIGWLLQLAGLIALNSCGCDARGTFGDDVGTLVGRRLMATQVCSWAISMDW